MTKIKLCGLKRVCDIEYVNELVPDYIGFVFAKGSKRYVTPQEAEVLRKQLRQEIIPVGVFVNEEMNVIADLIHRNIIQAVQLHGNEDAAYIRALQRAAGCTIIKAFQIKEKQDVTEANESPADYVLLDSGSGSGKVFDWTLLQEMKRPYFLAGGLTPENVGEAIKELHPYAVDASSSLESGGKKDREKMNAFVRAVRKGGLV